MSSRISKGSEGMRTWPGQALALLLAAGLAACGWLPPRGESSQAGSGMEQEEAESRTTKRAAQADRFEEPGELDRLVDARPLPFPAVKPVSALAAAAPAKAAPEASAGKGRFRIQVGAENDIDAAQAKKREYERILGGSVDVIFDAPYYKLRWGFFESKQEADDKILELTEHNIQGFVVKQ